MGTATKEEPVEERLPSHPQARVLAVFGVALAGLCALCAFQLASSGSWKGALTFAVIGAVVGGWFLGRIRLLDDLVAYSRALAHLLAGRLDAAERLLLRVRTRGLATSVATCLAEIALARGDFDRALLMAERSLEKKIRSPLSLLVTSPVAASGYATRALIRASRGDVDGARSDIAAVRGVRGAAAVARARAVVAELMVARTTNDVAALAAGLGAHERLLEHATPKERALVRAFARSTELGDTSAYRLQAARETLGLDERDPWVSAIAPSMGAMARPNVTGEARQVADPTRESTRAVPAPRSLGAKLYYRLGIPFVLVAGTLALLAGSVVASQTLSGNTPLLFLLVPPVAIFVGRRVLARRNVSQRLALLTEVACGEPGAEERARERSKQHNPLSAAWGYFALLNIEERAARFEAMLAAAEAGLARAGATRETKAASADLLLPGLMSGRAFAFAALGRIAEAHSVCDELTRAFPGYLGLAEARLRIGAVAATRSGDFALARDILRARPPHQFISYSDEALADALEVALGSVDEVERTRVQAMLQKVAWLRKWLDAVAPGLTERVRAANTTSVQEGAADATQEDDEAPRAMSDWEK